MGRVLLRTNGWLFANLIKHLQPPLHRILGKRRPDWCCWCSQVGHDRPAGQAGHSIVEMLGFCVPAADADALYAVRASAGFIVDSTTVNGRSW